MAPFRTPTCLLLASLACAVALAQPAPDAPREGDQPAPALVPAPVPGGEARIVTSDVDLFYGALRSSNGDLRDALQHEYLDKGSPGLREFDRVRIQGAAKLASVVRARRAYYEAIEPVLREAIADERLARRAEEAFAWIRERKPDAAFPTVYIVVGRMTSAGTIGRDALLIGAEMFGRAEGVPLDSLDAWAKEVLSNPADLTRVVVHEAVHALQPDRQDPSLLTAALREGACDFVAHLATGEPPRGPALPFARARLAALWPKFASRMDGADLRGWMYGKGARGEPTDLGYAVGYLICEAYYERAEDKDAAVRRIIEETDSRAFLRDSGFAESVQGGKASVSPPAPSAP
jgi:hypothetical protein